jgi:hypothetical protein
VHQYPYGDADDFDDVVHLEYTIHEWQLRASFRFIGKTQGIGACNSRPCLLKNRNSTN